MKLRNFEQTIINENNVLEFDFQLSNSEIKDIELLKLFNLEPNYFLPLEYNVDNDLVKCFSEYNEYKYLTDSSLTLLERYKLGYNLLKFLDLENSVLIPVIHPENIVLDVNNTPYLFYRGIANYLSPYAFDYDDVLLQLKCLIYALIEDTNNFESLYNGAIEMNLNSEFKKNIAQSNSKEELEQILLEAITNQEKMEHEKKVYVSRSRYSLFKNGSIIILIIAIIFGGISGYSYLVERPKLNDYILAGDKYVNNDYSGVIDTLSKYDIESLPKAQKQILAVASINVLSLTREQKKNILVGISASTNDSVLNCWIALGRGDFEAAKDYAIKADNADLYLYSLIRYKDELRSGTKYSNLSGSEVKAKLDEIDKEIEELNKKEEGSME